MKNTLEKYLIFPGKSTGGKASSLIKLKAEGFSVPYFQVIPTEYFELVLSKKTAEISEVDYLLQYAFSNAEKTAILDKLPEEYKTFSVRSSAMGEDGENHSFAGQFETFLHVDRATIWDKIRQVWASTFSDRIKFYKKQNNITSPLHMAVIIQAMVDASSSGVMFGVDPVSQVEGEMLISAVYGLGEGLVSGELNADNYRIKDGTTTSEEIAVKEKKLILSKDNKGVDWKEVPTEKQEIPALNEFQLHELTENLLRLNAFYQSPQDVEWAYENDKLYILQSRPITNLQLKSGTRIVWDNSNIIESYPGVTTPLTFSFIRDMYEAVYIQFCALLGVSPKTIDENNEVFANMLGLLRGRVYYNLLSWYKALALLPGYHLNAEFMAGMMGVKEKFELENKEQPSKSKAWYRMIVTIFSMIVSFIKLPRSRRNFLAFLDKTIADYKKIDFDNASSEELMNHYETFETILVEKWNPPLVNDFFAMIFFGIFQKLVKKWIDKDNPHLHNDLLSHSNDIISVQPMHRSLEIAKMILKDRQAKILFTENSSEDVWNFLQKSKDSLIKQKIDQFLYKFGERCLGELKLETISYTQAPEKYIKILQSYVNNPESTQALDTSKSEALRTDAQKIVKKSLSNPLKKWVFNYFMNKSRDLVSNRENLRFERTRGFGIVREIFSSMGKQFSKMDIIENDRDIFYLTKEEIFDYIKGKSVSQDLKRLIEVRKNEFQNFEEDSYVPERITTYGTVYNQLNFDQSANTLMDGDLKGIGCCAGIIKAEVVVIHSPDEIDDLRGRIMVTSSTDPGWVSLFPTASAILVERGSLLSHSAIVARELGIPCIVGITGLLSQLKTGDVVEMDGSSGHVKILENES